MVVLTFATTQLVAICARVNQVTISPVMNEHVMVRHTEILLLLATAKAKIIKHCLTIIELVVVLV